MKRNILLLGDNINRLSGVGRILHAIVAGTVDKFNWFQIAAASDISVLENYQVGNSYSQTINGQEVLLYPVEDFGSIELLKSLILHHNIDAIFFMTDPHRYDWLFFHAYTIRHVYKVPLVYYSIWDNFPIPLFNKELYNSVDYLIAINQNTDVIHTDLAPGVPNAYIPHGVDRSKFYPISPYRHKDEWDQLVDFKKRLKTTHNFDRYFFWNNVNQRRKNVTALIKAFKMFTNVCNLEKPDINVGLILHTDPVTEVGYDLETILRDLYPELPIIISSTKVKDEMLNIFYNGALATINCAYNEGFGLSNLEAIMAGCNTIATCTGGLQDQGTLTNLIDVEYQELSGSSMFTPYIYKDYISINKLAAAMFELINDPDKGMKTLSYPHIFESTTVERFVTQFDQKTMVNNIANILESVELLNNNYTLTTFSNE